MSMFNFVEYMSQVATLQPFGHTASQKRFYRLSGIRSLEEVLTSLLRAEVPALGADDSFEGRMYNPSPDLFLDKQFFVFYVFTRAKPFDFEEKQVKLRSVKIMASNIVSKLIKDHNTDFSLSTSFGLRYLDCNSISYRTIAPLPDGLIALAVSFTIDTPFNHNQTLA